MAEHGEQAFPEDGLSGTLTTEGHRLKARVYFADTDFSGVVYHARYLEFLERGRSDFLRLLGVRHTELAAGKHGERIVWVVRRMEIDFVRAAGIDDVLTIETGLQEVSGARLAMRQTISRGGGVLVSARIEAAILGENGRPRRFPKAWLDAFTTGRPLDASPAPGVDPADGRVKQHP